MKVTDPSWKNLENYLASITQLTAMQRLEILEKVDPSFRGAIAERRREARRSLVELSRSDTLVSIYL